MSHRFAAWMVAATAVAAVTSVARAQTATPPVPRAQTPATDAENEYTRAFDALWQDMDRHYSYFALKKANWDALGKRYRPMAARAKSTEQFLKVLEQMLAHLRDMHVWIEGPSGQLSPWGENYRRTWNEKAVAANLENPTRCGEYAIVGRTKPDGFGCMILTNQGAASEETVRQTVEAMGTLADAPGFLVDLRPGAFGGSEPLAMPIAQFFCAKDTVYARHQYRSGPKHDDLTEPNDRILRASEAPFTRPVVCLFGNRCMSSGEALVQMMMSLPNVTTVGERTRGSSGNPRPFALPGMSVQVWYSRWIDLMPDGTPIEGKGILPQMPMPLPPATFAQRDPVFERALLVLRQKIAAGPTQSAAPQTQPAESPK